MASTTKKKISADQPDLASYLALYPEKIDSTQPQLPQSVDLIRRFWLTPEVEEAMRDHAIVSYVAHVRMLGVTGIIPQDQAQRVEAGLLTLLAECKEKLCLLTNEDADINQAIFRRLGDLIGEDALVIDIAKSPNDHVATTTRLYLREASAQFFAKLLKIRSMLLALAERDLDVPMPGYTHMQPATPILLAHWWLANENRFSRDFERLLETFARLNVSPLGACALAGTSKPIDRSLVADYLGFDQVIENSLDAVTDRDFIIELASFASLVGVHLSQMSSELLLWMTQEFGFVRLPQSLTCKSANMPHKRNPEMMELLRARAASFSGRLTEFLGQLKGLPVSYTGDLKENLPGALDMVENLRFVMELASLLLPAFKFDVKRMLNQANTDLTNAGFAFDYLVNNGATPEKAREIMELVVDYCRQRHRQLTDLTPSEWQQFSPSFDRDLYVNLTVEESVETCTSFGGTATEAVRAALERAKERLELDKTRLPRQVLSRLNLDEVAVQILD
ncbi:MAG: argininosuccinate lyase [Cyanobacteria bacterium SZAS LIN-3]|nr:argininosuccinate lyase [Cyanobacteria bacterium SZAS LIN-3]